MLRTNSISVYFIMLLLISLSIGQTFEQQQLRFPRVRNSFSEKESTVKALFDSAHIQFPAAQIYIRIHKFEGELELWAAESPQDSFKIITRYNFCASSGHLGPKRQQGDFQIPEGFYYIDRFNPTSNFYLSLGLNYPNASDKILGNKESLGGDIFIHGDCVTIGCVPITDDKIKELYIIAVKARSKGQRKIPVHIFPFNFANPETAMHLRSIDSYQNNLPLWDDLEKGHQFFEKYRKLPQVKVKHTNGRYVISKIKPNVD